MRQTKKDREFIEKIRTLTVVCKASGPKRATTRRWPLLSSAAGVHPTQIPEMMRRFPQHEYAPDGRMIFRDRGHRKRCLKDIGMVDFQGYG